LSKPIVRELIVEEISDESLAWATELGLKSYHPQASDITPTLVKRANILQLKVGGWWYEWDPVIFRDLANARANHAFVNSPLQAMAALPSQHDIRIGAVRRMMWAANYDFGLPQPS
jgi:hypothetical protein